VCLPNGSEACLTLLALEQAGLTPCLMPAGWSEAELADAVEAAGMQAVVTQGVIGEERPADAFCRLAARYFGLRFVCAFGPLVPDGVVDLDRVILSTDAIDPDAVPTLDATAGAGVVTFTRRDGAPRPVFRSCQSLIASAVTFLVPARIRAGERILSLLPPDDHRGLVTGLIASLLSGATLETIGLFTTAGFCAALLRDEPTHLVAPGWMEDILSRGGLPESVVSVILVHEAPVRFKARTGLKRPVVDVLAFGEEALLTRARDPGGQFALSLDDEPGHASVTTRNLLRVRRDPDGAIHLAGLAAETLPFEKGSPRASGSSEAPGGWRASGHRADLFAGIVIGVS
jgi:acyl-CoA synthetase (AMP-forming)/AMP-acid ligase II